MQFGIGLLTARPDGYDANRVFDEAIEEAHIAEDLGFDAIWNFEHHYTAHGLSPNGMLQSAFILGRTKNILVGSGIAAIPLEHPLKLAERVALLDQLAPGRFLFGVGRGGFPKEFEVLGIDMNRNHEMFEQSIQLMREAWEGPVESKTGHYRFDQVLIEPPLRSGPPNIYIAARSPSTIEFAAKRGIPIMLGDEDDSLEFRRTQLDLYREVASAAGHDLDRLKPVVALGCIVSEQQEQAEEEMHERWLWYVRSGQTAWNLPKKAPELPNYEFHVRRRKDRALRGIGMQERVESVLRWNPVGTPDRCIERLQETIDVLEVENFLLVFEGSHSLQKVRCSMELFVEEVAPNLKPPSV